ncbi:hypothetical protein [Micromonospora sp. C81]|uniref:hypothetical protein n=1 Tax=Micromonospora sp. C81 TaxID=2824881 RepID=UPI001B381ABD|nr:hypothetical protein [Micromonospora sp. C81]MBQ1040068.1 hypothetical protein [Micromonospora sp. C81]
MNRMLQPYAELERPAALAATHPLVSDAYGTGRGSVVRGAGGSSWRRRGRVVG